ncbi:ExeM/NucH family extracellular endonuclease [Vibrio tapetis subsp. quintayensis]|uniref:ExeM/NucH family extracellular endonuclease n=1 Tax=Vibrio tapetis TaxID=52443 RepID=UPI0025B51C8B|nr:ExeM/NucH family extracellular endonuclease [Vibrio tapetis]MDN3679407.1 ExeM/NucH family extracellular endonuclease [Vibrio tapetis subsp. quintayensis]
MKFNLLALSIGAVCSFGAQANIVISEYIEGGGHNKAIEIANTGNSDVNLAGYQLATKVSGKGDLTKHYSYPSVILKPNQVFVLSHKDAIAAINTKAEIIGEAVINHNGDETYALLKDGTVVDSLGTEGDVDWGKDKTYERTDLTPYLSPTFDENKWNIKPKNSHTDLGLLNGIDAGEPDMGPKPIPLTSIMELQGSSWKSPFTDPANGKYTSDETFVVQGVITAIQTSNTIEKDLPTGYFIQDEQGDNNPKTSDAIFVVGEITGLNIGQKVQVTGSVVEDFGWTKFTANSVEIVGSGTITPTVIKPLSSDTSYDFTLERHESMLVSLEEESKLKVTRSFSKDYGPDRNNMVVAHERINVHPNQNHLAGSKEAQNQANCNEDKRLIIESFEKAAVGTIPWYPDFAMPNAAPMDDGTTTSEHYIRIGDTINGLQGVVGYSHSDYRLYVTNKANLHTFSRDHVRPTQPALVKSGLRIATFNVLNYFNSPFGGEDNPTNTNRGAQSAAEFERQGDKIVSALIAMNADAIGLMEIENNGFGENSAIAHLVNKVNARLPEADHYAYVTGDSTGDGNVDQHIGNGAIANQVIFKPTKLTLSQYRIIKMPEQRGGSRTNYQRDAVTPSFKINGTEQSITLSVNHFKSKGGSCLEDTSAGNNNDLQGACENFRVSAAKHLATELESVGGYKLILGDLNSYAKEDPLLVLTNIPDGYKITPAKNTFIGNTAMDGETPTTITQSFNYRNLIQEKHPLAYSYSYQDTVGSLDYILADQATAAKVAAAEDWNINAAESTLFEYPESKSGDLTSYTDAYRASDHNPALVVLKLNSSVTPPKKVTPPNKPLNPPKALKEKPDSPKAGKQIKVLMDLTSLGMFDLHVGDIASLNFSKITSFNAAMAGDISTPVTLTEDLIEQGWIELTAQVSKKGNYQMTKVIQGATGETYQSPAVEIEVATSSDTNELEGTSNSGGSTGLLSLLALAGFTISRSKKRK